MMKLEEIFNIMDLPKELILQIMEFAIDRIDAIAVLFNVNKELRGLVRENYFWIHVGKVLDSQKSITPIQKIIRNNFYSPDGQIFVKLQEYFQSLPYIQYIQLRKQDGDDNQDTMVFDPFSKLTLYDTKSFSDFIQVFGINSFRAFHTSNLTNSSIMDTMDYDGDVAGGETIIQASFVVGEKDEKW